MIEDISAFAERHLGGVGTSVASFVRIHVWAVAFLVVISLLAPSREPNVASLPVNRSIRDPAVRSLGLAYSDPRGFAPNPFPKSRFRIAWITGSEGEMRDKGYYKFVPQLVARALPSIAGRMVGVDLYFLDAMRLTDTYIALLDAIRSKPDMIVFALNPAWVLNPLATHQWGQLDNIAAQVLATKPSAWPVSATFLSPSDLAWSFAASELKPFRDRAYYSQRLHSVIDDLGPLDRAGLSQIVQRPDLYARVLAMLPVDFWYRYRLDEPRALGPVRWAQWLRASGGGGGDLNKTLLGAIASAMKDSKIPTFVYLAQVNTAWLTTRPEIISAVAEIEGRLDKLRAEFTAANILYQPQTVSRFVSGLTFANQDLVHLKRGDPLGPYLAGRLCDLLARARPQDSCELAAKGPRHA